MKYERWIIQQNETAIRVDYDEFKNDFPH